MKKIQNMHIQAALVIFLMLPAAVKAATQAKVEFWKEKVTLTCPEEGKWFKKGKEIAEVKDDLKTTYDFQYNGKGTYSCEYGAEKTHYYFYVEGKVCENCFELEASLLLGIISADVFLTVIVMVIVYKCTKGKSSPGSSQPSRAPVHSGGRAPPVPSPDYEQLNPHTRTHDPYSFVNRTG